MALRLYNTRTRNIDEFVPIHPPTVTMYNCGPTVYGYPHIGNLRAYVTADILRRALEYGGYTVRQIVNITDVGHLVTDQDEGEDKIEVGARREGKKAEEIIAFYSNIFFKNLEDLNIKKAERYPRATAFIDQQKRLIEILSERKHTYITSDGIYFDTTTFPRYGEFAQLDVEGLRSGARVDLGEKRHPTDFALWKFSPERSVAREQEWPSPLGIRKMGFPGWHIECSAIAMALLGETIDIHSGGVDHIPIHHTNEIAQSECATGKSPFARFWLHVAFMLIDGQKMSKSLNNTYTLADVIEKGIHPLSYRYLLLTSHYRTQMNFTWESVLAAQEAYERLRRNIHRLGTKRGNESIQYVHEFAEYINDDLNTPKAIALIWRLLKDESVSREDKRATMENFDRVLGLDLFSWTEAVFDIPDDIQELLQQRQCARENKEWDKSDTLRLKIREKGYDVTDTPEGQRISSVNR